MFGIVRQASGDIRVYSEPGRGTTFKVYFPAIEERAEERGEGGEPAVPGRGDETVLVVEDEDVVRRFTCRVLEGHGYRVLSASDGAAALEVVSGHRGAIDLLVTDVVMPDMDGPTLAGQLGERIERWRFFICRVIRRVRLGSMKG